jgi:hypothetical protein
MDDDYIQFEGPLRAGPSVRRLTDDDVRQLKDTIRKIKERRLAREAVKETK